MSLNLTKGGGLETHLFSFFTGWGVFQNPSPLKGGGIQTHLLLPLQAKRGGFQLFSSFFLPKGGGVSNLSPPPLFWPKPGGSKLPSLSLLAKRGESFETSPPSPFSAKWGWGFETPPSSFLPKGGWVSKPSPILFLAKRGGGVRNSPPSSCLKGGRF